LNWEFHVNDLAECPHGVQILNLLLADIQARGAAFQLSAIERLHF
jgi:hypothetical protein